MTIQQNDEIQAIRDRLKMEPGTFRRLVLETFPGESCGLRSLVELSQHQAGTLLGKLRQIEAAQKPQAVLA